MENIRKEIRRLIREIAETLPNVSTGDRRNNLRNYVEDNVDLTGYGEYEDVPRSRRLDAVADIFRDEKGWDIERSGEKRAFIDYLRGMPSILDIATYYDEIRNLMYALGYDEVRDMEDDEIDRLYYDELYSAVMGR